MDTLRDELAYCLDIWEDKGWCAFWGGTKCDQCAAPYLSLKMITWEVLHGDMKRLSLKDWKRKLMGIMESTENRDREHALTQALSNEKYSVFLKILEMYKLKHIARNCSNFYHDSKEDISYKRKETAAEHVYSSLKLADFFLLSEEEFKELDKLKALELLMYHDDIEILTQDTCISQREKREMKSTEEALRIPELAKRYPSIQKDRLLALDKEYRENSTAESQFAHAVDKMDALIHELQYPADWKLKGFTEENVIQWFQPAFEYSPTFMKYFRLILEFLRENEYV